MPSSTLLFSFSLYFNFSGNNDNDEFGVDLAVSDINFVDDDIVDVGNNA